MMNPKSRATLLEKTKPAPAEAAEELSLQPADIDFDPERGIEEWAERFATTMERREKELERRRPHWSPLSLLGFEVR